MAKLYFKTGCMNSGKSTRLLQAAHQYESLGMRVLCFKPSVDTREDEFVIKSRLGIKREALAIYAEDNLFTEMKEYIKYVSKFEKIDIEKMIIMIDEAQFLTEEQIDQLQDTVYELNINVLAYGLKTDFRGKLFPASKRLIEIADSIHEEKSICKCGRAAKQNARVVNGKIVTEGEIIQVGGNESYIALCNKCFRNKNIKIEN